MNIALDDLLIHARTRGEVELFMARPAHALLITGPQGSGKATLALSLSAGVLGASNLSNYPYFMHITRPQGKKDIPVEDIRKVLHNLRLKTTGNRAIRRIVFVEDAHYLSEEAQNTLLKMIEEPASDTLFLLSAISERSVLPTVASRAQRLRVYPSAQAQAQKYYQSQKTEPEIASAWQLSQGNSGLMHALLFNEEEHPLKSSVELAKNLLRATPYERLVELDKLSKDKEQLAMALTALSMVLTALHRAALDQGNSRQIDIGSGRRLVRNLHSSLEANGSPRLVALELALNLKV